MFYEILSLICVAILWGGTNPIIKRNTRDITEVKADSRWLQFILEVKYLITNFKYLAPMLLNQLGSLLYFLTLQEVDLSLTVPIANSLTFVFTALFGWILGEHLSGKGTIIGCLLVLSGTFFCCYDKYLNKVL